MVTVRLARAGTKKVPFYRVVVTDSRSPRDGKFIESVGTWDPRANEGVFHLNQVRYDYWVKVGARPSEMVAKLVTRARRAAAEAAAKA